LQQSSSINAVGERSGEGRQADDRDAFDQTDESDGEGGVGELLDLPEVRGRGRLASDLCKDDAEPEGTEVRMVK
jgi:hypothetical protein